MNSFLVDNLFSCALDFELSKFGCELKYDPARRLLAAGDPSQTYGEIKFSSSGLFPPKFVSNLGLSWKMSSCAGN
jgi:hypothetical protein